MKKIRIHHHPKMEKILQVPEGHCIIDNELYCAIEKEFGPSIPDTLEEELRRHLEESEKLESLYQKHKENEDV